MARQLANGDLKLADVAATIHDVADPHKRLLIVADQFEELYTLCADRDARHKFLEALLSQPLKDATTADSRYSFLFALRADFLEEALRFRPLADGIQSGMFLLGPMTRAELRLAIEKPAEMQGVSFEAGLVERILDDVGDEPGNLPSLEFALTSLWAQQGARLITHSSYEAEGRVSGAAASRSDPTRARSDRPTPRSDCRRPPCPRSSPLA